MTPSHSNKQGSVRWKKKRRGKKKEVREVADFETEYVTASQKIYADSSLASKALYSCLQASREWVQETERVSSAPVSPRNPDH